MQARTSQKGSLTAESTEEEGPPLYRRLDGGLDGLDGLDGENRRRADDVHEKKGLGVTAVMVAMVKIMIVIIDCDLSSD